MNIFMVWHSQGGDRIWYTVSSEDLESFFCELFPVNVPITLDPPQTFMVKKVEGGWHLGKECDYQKGIAHQIEKYLEEDKELKKY